MEYHQYMAIDSHLLGEFDWGSNEPFCFAGTNICGGDAAPDVFVAKISSENDHNYSLVIHNEPEVEVETVLETIIPYNQFESNFPLNTTANGKQAHESQKNVNIGNSSCSTSTVLVDSGPSASQLYFKQIESPSNQLSPLQLNQNGKRYYSCKYERTLTIWNITSAY